MPWKYALHLLVVPDAVEDEHVKGAEAAPRALQDLGRLLGGNSTDMLPSRSPFLGLFGPFFS